MIIRFLIIILSFSYPFMLLATSKHKPKPINCSCCKTSAGKHKSHLCNYLHSHKRHSIAQHRSISILHLIHQILAHLSFNHYQLGGTYVNLKKGVYRVDCSKYVDFLLKHTAPHAYRHVESRNPITQPTSLDYFDFFEKIPPGEIRYNWYRVPTVKSLKPGDILVFRYKYLLGRKTAGHIMVIVQRPQLSLKLHNAYLVRVSDSAPGGHTRDTRLSHTSGIGIGTLLLAVNPHTGRPFAYAWKWGWPWRYNMQYAMARPMHF